MKSYIAHNIFMMYSSSSIWDDFLNKIPKYNKLKKDVKTDV